MDNKLAKANKNIEILIEELISIKEYALGDAYCPYGGPRNPENDCDISCSNCKQRYFENMREAFLEKYIVK